MSLAAAAHSEIADTRAGLRLFLLLAVPLTVLRLVGLGWSAVDLYVDEAQYWLWSRELAFGYFSKPPLIAWLLALADSACGSGEACLRAPAPLIHLATSLLIYATAAELYDRRVASWAALTMLVAPGIVFSTRIISTDVPLLFFWALALLSFVKLARGRAPAWGVGLAVGLGFGLLSKFAMAYFLFGIALAGLADAECRALLRRPILWASLAGGVLLFLPNLIWNAGHGFLTFRHVGDDAVGGGVSLDIAGAAEFIASQFGVAGPVVFAVLLALLWRFGRNPSSDRLLLAFALPPLAIITAVALMSGANANWAAPALISAFIVVPAVLLRHRRPGWLVAGIVLGLGAQGLLILGDSMADRITLPFLARGDVYARSMGWREMAKQAGAIAERAGAGSLVAARRSDIAGLGYYLRDHPRVHAWPSADGVPHDHFQLSRPLTGRTPAPVVAVSECGSPASAFAGGAGIVELGRFTVAAGPSTSRHYGVFRLPGADPLSAGFPSC